MTLLSNTFAQSGLFAFIVSFLFSCPQLFAQQQQVEQETTKRTVIIVKDGNTSRHIEMVTPNKDEEDIEIIVIEDDHRFVDDIDMVIEEDQKLPAGTKVITKEVNVKVDEDGTTTKTITLVIENPDGSRDTTVEEIVTIIEEDDEEHTKHMVWITDDGQEQEFEIEEDFEFIVESDEVDVETENISVRVMILNATKEDVKFISPEIEPETNILSVNDLHLFPNPNGGQFDLKFNGEKSKKLKLAVYNMAGEMIFEDAVKNFNGQYSGNVDLSTHKKGTYILLIDNGKESFTKKIIIQ